MAGTTGLEPATPSVTGWYSNQLSYVPTSSGAISYISEYFLQGDFFIFYNYYNILMQNLYDGEGASL